MKKDAQTKGGIGRGMDNKKSRTTKHNQDRVVDKRRRQEDKVESKPEPEVEEYPDDYSSSSAGYGGWGHDE